MTRLPLIIMALIAGSAAICLYLLGAPKLAIIMAVAFLWLGFVALMPATDGSSGAKGRIRLGGMTWDLEDFVRHWGIFGKTGTGKTLAVIKTLMGHFYRAFPDAGGIMLDEKGDFSGLARGVFKAMGKEDKLIVVQAPEHKDTREPAVTINLIGDPAISWQDYADMIVAVAQSQGQRNEQSFFKTQARDRIAECFATIEIAGLIPTLSLAYDFFTRKTDRDIILAALKKAMHAAQEPCDERLDALKSAEKLPHDMQLRDATAYDDELSALYDTYHDIEKIWDLWQEFEGKAGDEASGIRSSIQNYLRPYCAPGLDKTFSCTNPKTNIDLNLIDQGKVIVPSVPQSYISGRRYIMAFFKVRYYVHGLRRFDAMNRGEPRGNPLVLWSDEGHNILLQTEDGVSDINSLDKLRAAHCTVVMAMQDFASALPPLGGQEKADVLFANLSNMVIFAMNTPKARKIAADIIGEDEQEERSISMDSRSRRSRTTSRRMKHILPPIFFSRLPKFKGVIIHAEGKWLKAVMPPLTDDGKKVEPWFYRVYFVSSVKSLFGLN